jgi:hypothetical protein
MATTPLTRNETYDVRKVQARLEAHDSRLDAVDETGTLPVNSVSNTELRDSAALTVIGRSANSTGDPADIAATAASGAVLRESGSVLGFGTLTNAALAAGILSADATGRALVATDFFNAATILLKIADGAFAADTDTRALFGDGIWTAAKLASSAVETAKIATGAVTGAKIAAAALEQFMVTAGNGSGARTMTGAAVGDKVVAVMNITDGTDNSADFEATVTVTDQIQQTATNIDNDKCIVTVIKV